jgi:hypothetical protein
MGVTIRVMEVERVPWDHDPRKVSFTTEKSLDNQSFQPTGNNGGQYPRGLQHGHLPTARRLNSSLGLHFNLAGASTLNPKGFENK